MACRGFRCALGDHKIRGTGVTVTNQRHISFIKKVWPNYRDQQQMCQQCKMLMEHIYKYKMERAIRQRRRKVGSSYSVSSVTTSSKEVNLSKFINTPTGSENSTPQNSHDRPTTSAAAAAKLKKRQRYLTSMSSDSDEEASINIRRGVRLPNVQPALKRQTFVHANPDIMKIYLQGLTGG